MDLLLVHVIQQVVQAIQHALAVIHVRGIVRVLMDTGARGTVLIFPATLVHLTDPMQDTIAQGIRQVILHIIIQMQVLCTRMLHRIGIINPVVAEVRELQLQLI